MFFKNAKVYIDGRFENTNLEVIGDTIANIGPWLAGPGEDLQGAYLVPGFIDIHTHGCIGEDFTDGNRQGVYDMCAEYARHGVTGICATVMTASKAQMEQAVQLLGQISAADDTRCRILGIHAEGPFFGQEKRGAHDAQYLLPPEIEWFEKLCSLSGERIKMVCIDPTLDKSMEFIRHFAKKMRVSVAHTTAGYQKAVAAVDAGASNVTHLFNAMQGMHHRNPGVIGAVAQRDITAELICDGIHIHPAVLRLVFAAFPQKMVMISDSVRPAGLSDGEYICGGIATFVKSGKATLEDGTIAGSTSNIHAGVKNLVAWGIPLEQAIYSATALPAKVLGVEDTVGSIAVGKRADLVILDQDLEIKTVLVRGKAI